MYGVELCGRVRLAVLRDRMSRREAARRFGIDRGTVAKILKHSSPPGYTRVMPVRRPKLAGHVSFIERVLDEDEAAPRKRRHTARPRSSSGSGTSAAATAATRPCGPISARPGWLGRKRSSRRRIRRATRRPTSARRWRFSAGSSRRSGSS